jgi:hypothetical protein
MGKESGWNVRLPLMAAMLGGIVMLPAGVSAQQPDFTGVWTTYTEPAQGRGGGGGARGGGGGRGGGAALPLRPEAEKKIAAYRALVAPTSDTPGGHCLGSGMP